MKQSPSLPMSLPLAGWAAWRGGMAADPSSPTMPLWRQAIQSALDADRFDLEDWETARQAIPMLTSHDQQAAEEFCGHPVQDSFMSLFKSAPRLADPLEHGLEPLADLLHRGMATPEWQRLRETTIGDQIAAGVGSQAFVEEILAALPEEVKEQARAQARAQRETDQLQADANALSGLLDALHERYAGAELPDETVQQAADLQSQIGDLSSAAAQAQAQADQARVACESSVQQQTAQIAAALNKAASTARAQAEEASTFASGFSLAAGGDAVHVSPETARLAMQTLRQNPNLKDLADLLGWARQLVRAAWRNSPRARTELVGYKTRSLQPEHMAGSEWAALLSGDETLEADWQRRALDSAIRHRQYGGKEEEGRGPLIIVRDESGSMAGAPHALAVALEWALLEIARRDNRPFYSISFSGSGQYAVWHAGEADAQSLAEHLAHFYNGGTELYGPLTEACKVVRTVNSDQQRADILVITDGLFGAPSEMFLNILDRLRETESVKIALVSVGAENPDAQVFADPIIHVNDLLKERDKLRGAIAAIV
ncbi:Protein ViaA [Thermoflexales bacterium]|nr:Protein ViaA [Thermoflexales bacterium]